MMEFFTKKIGVPYAWDKYSQVTVADFIFGGNGEHVGHHHDGPPAPRRAGPTSTTPQTASWPTSWPTSGGETCLPAETGSHGWLNEGFATYSELLFREFDLGVDEFRYGVYQDAGIYFRGGPPAITADPSSTTSTTSQWTCSTDTSMRRARWCSTCSEESWATTAFGKR